MYSKRLTDEEKVIPKGGVRMDYLDGLRKAFWGTMMVLIAFICVVDILATPKEEPEKAEPPCVPTAADQFREVTKMVEELPRYSQKELELLALVIYQEAGGDSCSDETRLMVGNVVLNRVEDSRYPDDLEGVLTQRAQYGHLHWTGIQWPERASKPEEARAVQRAYDCAEDLLNGQRVLPKDVVFQAEFTQGSEVVAHQDGLYFCR